MFLHHFSPAFRSALTSLFSVCFSNFSRENRGFILSTSAAAEAPLPVGSRQTETIPPISLGVLRCETTNDIMLSNNCIDQDLVMQLSNCGHDKNLQHHIVKSFFNIERNSNPTQKNVHNCPVFCASTTLPATSLLIKTYRDPLFPDKQHIVTS